MVVLHFQLARATGTFLRRGFRLVTFATISTTFQSTSSYRLLVGLAGSMIYALLLLTLYRTLKFQKRKYFISKILQLKKICTVALFKN